MPTACRAEAAFQDGARASELGTCPQLSLVGGRRGPGDLSLPAPLPALRLREGQRAWALGSAVTGHPCM